MPTRILPQTNPPRKEGEERQLTKINEVTKNAKYGLSSTKHELTDAEKTGIFSSITDDSVLTKVQDLLHIVIEVKRSTYNAINNYRGYAKDAIVALRNASQKEDAGLKKAKNHNGKAYQALKSRVDAAITSLKQAKKDIIIYTSEEEAKQAEVDKAKKRLEQIEKLLDESPTNDNLKSGTFSDDSRAILERIRLRSIDSITTSNARTNSRAPYNKITWLEQGQEIDSDSKTVTDFFLVMNNLFPKASLDTNALINENNANCLKHKDGTTNILRKKFTIQWNGTSKPDGKPANDEEKKPLAKEVILGYSGAAPFDPDEEVVKRIQIEHDFTSLNRNYEFVRDQFSYIDEIKRLVTSKGIKWNEDIAVQASFVAPNDAAIKNIKKEEAPSKQRLITSLRYELVRTGYDFLPFDKMQSQAETDMHLAEHNYNLEKDRATKLREELHTIQSKKREAENQKTLAEKNLLIFSGMSLDQLKAEFNAVYKGGTNGGSNNPKYYPFELEVMDEKSDNKKLDATYEGYQKDLQDNVYGKILPSDIIETSNFDNLGKNIGEIIKNCKFKDANQRSARLGAIKACFDRIKAVRHLGPKEDDLYKNIQKALTGQLPEEKDEIPQKDDLQIPTLAAALGIAESDTTQTMKFVRETTPENIIKTIYAHKLEKDDYKKTIENEMKAKTDLKKSEYGGDEPKKPDMVKYLYDKELGKLQTNGTDSPTGPTGPSKEGGPETEGEGTEDDETGEKKEKTDEQSKFFMLVGAPKTENNNPKEPEIDYEVESIQVPKGDIDSVRNYPAMYIGSTDEQEVIDNSIDEAVAGYCNQIKITLSADQKTLTVEDNGRGAPIEKHLVIKKNSLETIFTILHAGGKLKSKVYKTSGGLHGIGVTAVNALSAYLRAENCRQQLEELRKQIKACNDCQEKDKTGIVEFREGNLINSQIIDTPKKPSGTVVTFTPDPKIFPEFTYFKIETIQNRLKDLAYLNPNLTLIFYPSPEATPITYHFSSGLAENTEVCMEELTDSVSLRKDEGGNYQKEYFYLNFAFQYNQAQKKSQIKSFCNNIITGGGGSHLDGFENEGLTAILSIRVKDPQFSGQTKYRLAMSPVREVVKNITYDLVKKFLQDHANSAEAISKKIIETAENRAKTEEYQKSLREGGQGVALSGKLAPCISKDVANNELFIVEGESAGGSAKSARNPYNQAVLPVQGKILNVIRAK
ncbi:12474_t:CDS:10 [Entrophospora sp. SA101]|nr:12474_t:CDS:10 [Entrophospora sp. SA101]